MAVCVFWILRMELELERELKLSRVDDLRGQQLREGGCFVVYLSCWSLVFFCCTKPGRTVSQDPPDFGAFDAGAEQTLDAWMLLWLLPALAPLVTPMLILGRRTWAGGAPEHR